MIMPSDDLATFPCAQCGAEMRYAPAEAELVCGYCGSRRAIEHAEPRLGPWERPGAEATRADGWDAAVVELDYLDALARAADGVEDALETTRAVACDSCGARTTLPPNVEADLCPFCAAPLVGRPDNRRAIAPQAVLPFAVAEREAKSALRRWLSRRWFAPNDLARAARADGALSGVYLPFWTYAALTESNYSGARGRVRQEQRGFGKNRRTVTRTDWTPVRGRVRRAFDDVLVLASKTLSTRARSVIGTGSWDLRGLQRYDPAFLAGFRAEAYAIDLEEGFARARAAMDAQIRRDVRRDIGGDRQRIYSVRTRVSDVTFKHVLLPVWIAAYRYGDRGFAVVVNGRTGRVAGERPYAAWKIALASALAAIAAVGLFVALAASGAFD